MNSENLPPLIPRVEVIDRSPGTTYVAHVSEIPKRPEAAETSQFADFPEFTLSAEGIDSVISDVMGVLTDLDFQVVKQETIIARNSGAKAEEAIAEDILQDWEEVQTMLDVLDRAVPPKDEATSWAGVVLGRYLDVREKLDKPPLLASWFAQLAGVELEG